jgi:hypothetical protein
MALSNTFTEFIYAQEMKKNNKNNKKNSKKAI